MNRTANFSVSSIAAAIGIATTSLLSLPAQAATPSTGVNCPANTEASLQGGVLRCKVTLVYERGSMCPRIDFPNYINIEIAGSDICKPAIAPLKDRASVASAMTPVPGPPVLKGQTGIPADVAGYLTVLGSVALAAPADSAYNRVVRSGADKFVGEKSVFLWPAGYPLHKTVGHNPSNGLACPAGFDDVSIAGGRGLRCEKLERRNAGCDPAWQIDRDVDGNTDACFLNLPIGRTKGNYTIPVGMVPPYTGAIGDPDKNGWNLKARNGIDVWEREQIEFRFADAR